MAVELSGNVGEAILFIVKSMKAILKELSSNQGRNQGGGAKGLNLPFARSKL